MQKSKSIKKLQATADTLKAHLIHCGLCPRECAVNRTKGEAGYCKAPANAIAYTAFKHRGEEPGISARGGSGTIFFSGCTLRCGYCQNYKFSHTLNGTPFDDNELAKLILKLEHCGADNINLVTPTHFLPQIAAACAIAFKNGLKLPVVYNTSGFEKPDIIKTIEPLVDIYLTDIKYIDNETAQKYSNAAQYPQYALAGAKAMYQQQPKVIIRKGKITHGLIIRHLVLPGQLCASKNILRWIKDNTPGAKTSIMFQYQPYHNAQKHPEINRKVDQNEYEEICNYIEDLELDGWVQELEPQENLAGTHFKPGIHI